MSCAPHTPLRQKQDATNKHKRRKKKDARKTLKPLRELVSQEAHVLEYIRVGELARGKVLREGEQLRDEHRGEVG